MSASSLSLSSSLSRSILSISTCLPSLTGFTVSKAPNVFSLLLSLARFCFGFCFSLALSLSVSRPQYDSLMFVVVLLTCCQSPPIYTNLLFLFIFMKRFMRHPHPTWNYIHLDSFVKLINRRAYIDLRRGTRLDLCLGRRRRRRCLITFHPQWPHL